MPGDRIFGSPRSVECNFLGATAKFPLGPFAVASQKEVPMLAVFVMKNGVKSYRIFVHRIQGNTRQELCRSFAAELEKTVTQYPTQWFNFYNFWK
jgi:predicted LPLAT superfamily acyltransferase